MSSLYIYDVKRVNDFTMAVCIKDMNIDDDGIWIDIDAVTDTYYTVRKRIK